jgi:hypothetical protein
MAEALLLAQVRLLWAALFVFMRVCVCGCVDVCERVRVCGCMCGCGCVYEFECLQSFQDFLHFTTSLVSLSNSLLSPPSLPPFLPCSAVITLYGNPHKAHSLRGDGKDTHSC